MKSPKYLQMFWQSLSEGDGRDPKKSLKAECRKNKLVCFYD